MNTKPSHERHEIANERRPPFFMARKSARYAPLKIAPAGGPKPVASAIDAEPRADLVRVTAPQEPETIHSGVADEEHGKADEVTEEGRIVGQSHQSTELLALAVRRTKFSQGLSPHFLSFRRGEAPTSYRHSRINC